MASGEGLAIVTGVPNCAYLERVVSWRATMTLQACTHSPPPQGVLLVCFGSIRGYHLVVPDAVGECARWPNLALEVYMLAVSEVLSPVGR